MTNVSLKMHFSLTCPNMHIFRTLIKRGPRASSMRIKEASDPGLRFSLQREYLFGSLSVSSLQKWDLNLEQLLLFFFPRISSLHTLGRFPILPFMGY